MSAWVELEQFDTDGFCVTATGGLPAEIAAELRTAYARLGADVPVAVRSSSGEISLDVVGADAVVDAVRRYCAGEQRTVAVQRMNGPTAHVDFRLSLARGVPEPTTPMGLDGLRLIGTSLSELIDGRRSRFRALSVAVAPSSAHRRVRRASARVTTLLGAATRSTAARLDFVERLLRTEATALLHRLPAASAAGVALTDLARKALGKTAHHSDLQTVLRGHDLTAELDLELWALAERVRTDEESVRALDDSPETVAARYRVGALPAVLQDGLVEFFGQHGHRGVTELDLGTPRWSEDPAPIVAVLADHLRATDAPEGLAARAEAAERKIAELAARVGLVRGRIARFALGRARKLAALRETPKYLLVRILAAARRELRMVGAELVAADRLDAPTDVFFLDLRDVRSQGDLRTIVAERRATYELELRRRVPWPIQPDELTVEQAS
ncbi:hypothetical protein HPO96_01690 [Kribbella sandramycini]|uniref:Uncharacterized protein n=1 Tax=Kribbella sandramycini TaxID=60450 RepID=A0A7Y4KUI6_9ACTN|nr:hypothetical protein [Kribbella sandramycini]MBB6568462.1 hypothetical protein [Kribbella sandramycini]NOL38948.1 hypothetical protein [Kribbella sandramycini]